ncbi:hypothetical protein V8B97DRAFT_1917022 [Scleroderma yunnanense]
MVNTCPPSGWYTITTHAGHVGTDHGSVVVPSNGVRFYLNSLGNCTYQIYLDNQPGSVEQDPSWRLVIEKVGAPQKWVFRQYDNEANTFRLMREFLIASTAALPKQLYLSVVDFDNVVPQQRYTIVIDLGKSLKQYKSSDLHGGDAEGKETLTRVAPHKVTTPMKWEWSPMLADVAASIKAFLGWSELPCHLVGDNSVPSAGDTPVDRQKASTGGDVDRDHGGDIVTTEYFAIAHKRSDFDPRVLTGTPQ